MKWIGVHKQGCPGYYMNVAEGDIQFLFEKHGALVFSSPSAVVGVDRKEDGAFTVSSVVLLTNDGTGLKESRVDDGRGLETFDTLQSLITGLRRYGVDFEHLRVFLGGVF